MSPIKFHPAKSLIGTSIRRALLTGFVCMSNKVTIFGRNLRALCRRKRSISSFARDLEAEQKDWMKKANALAYLQRATSI